MNQYLDFLTDKLKDVHMMSLPDVHRHRISVDDMAIIMGVPTIAIHSLAKGSGMKQSEWIDVNSLDVFEDAYIRKLKAYFKRMIRNVDGTGSIDLCTFIEFCKTFKKPNLDSNRVIKWDDIDEDAIRKQFRLDVQEKSRVEHDEIGVSFLFAGIEGIVICEKHSLVEHVAGHIPECSKVGIHHQVLHAVVTSLAYHLKDNNKPKNGCVSRTIRHTITTGHYYLYCQEDKDDHHNETVYSDGLLIPFYNSTRMMAI